MTTATLRKRLIKTIEKLPKDKLEELNSFISAIEGDDEATEELLSIPGLLDDIKKAEKEIKQGKIVNWRDVRKNV